MRRDHVVFCKTLSVLKNISYIQIMATVTEQAWRSHYYSTRSHLLQSGQHYVESFLAVEFGTGDGGTTILAYSSIGWTKDV